MMRIQKPTTLRARLQFLTLLILVPLGVLVGVLLFTVFMQNNQYNLIVRNVTTASEFNIDFKKSLDAKMYKYIVGGYQNFEQYTAFDDVHQARALVERLQKTTTRKDSLACLHYIAHYLDNVEKYIERTRVGMGYDQGMLHLENNIYVVTELITDEMYNYIYAETRELTALQQRTDTIVKTMISIVSILTVILLGFLWLLAVKNAKSIADPIHELSENIKMVGEGDFTIRPVISDTSEIQTLSQAFDQMVKQIDELISDLENEKETLRRTELQLLQAQINPHFLYNTFDTIIWLAEDNQTKQVVEITTSLSNFFRTSLSKGKVLISLKEEELHVRSYLEIQQVRYRDRLTYEINIPEELYSILLPKLSLQPLVENALYHGIKKKREMGKITISARRDADAVILVVEDNGIGMEKDQMNELNAALQEMDNRTDSFGCFNVHERIKLCYGEGYGLAFESVYGQGTRASIKLPS